MFEFFELTHFYEMQFFHFHHQKLDLIFLYPNNLNFQLFLNLILKSCNSVFNIK